MSRSSEGQSILGIARRVLRRSDDVMGRAWYSVGGFEPCEAKASEEASVPWGPER